MRLLTLALILLSAAQNPQPDPNLPPSPEVQVTPTKGERKEIERLTKAMQGLWTLRKLDWPVLNGVSSEFRGFCLVSENHLSFEVHIGLRSSRDVINDTMLDSGMWRYEVADGGRLILTALIGTYLDRFRRAVFREAGTQLRYEVMAQGDQMVWRKSDGQRLEFMRLPDGETQHVDAFGRTVKEKKVEEPPDKGATKDPKKEKDH